MNLKYKIILFVVLHFGLILKGHCQDFITGINLYNRAQYDSLIFRFAPDFLKKNQKEIGLAHYFIAESYYNKALQETDKGTALKFLNESWSALKKAEAADDLKQNFLEYNYFIRYKMGWCSFRVAELGYETIAKYNQGYNEFISVSAKSPDSLRIFAKYMAAESKQLENANIFLKLIDTRFSRIDLNRILDSYSIIDNLYDQILAFLPDFPDGKFSELFDIVKIKKDLLNYTYARFYQILAIGQSDDIKALNNFNSFKQLALSYFDRIDYEKYAFSLQKKELKQSALSYLQLNQYLNKYLSTFDLEIKNEFFLEWNKKIDAEFNNEKYFGRANIYHGNPSAESDEVNVLALAFYDSAKSIPESGYWLAYLQMIKGENKKSNANFIEFIQFTENIPRLSRRYQVLVEDARYRKYLLDFEAYYLANDFTRLRELADAVQDFHPENLEIQSRVTQLNLMANCSITQNSRHIWNNVLKGTEEEKLDQAISTIRLVLPRAALNIGIVRERYIKLLQSLFSITEVKRSDETRFFRGIVKSLEAEIEATPFDKVDKFNQAADIMLGVNQNYKNKNEADYIRARCLFFADDFETAKSTLLPLVNEHKYLRALFYLAEIFRLDGMGKAAKICYSKIISTLQHADYFYDEFWLSNAIAGLEASDDSGNLAILDSVRLNSIEFQPELNPDLLTYEKLAEEKHLKKQLVRQSIEWLISFGLPQKDIYPSVNRFAQSLLTENNYFEKLSGIINEKRGQITSSLVLAVQFPEGVSKTAIVRLSGEELVAQDGLFIKHAIPLNAELELTVGNKNCYDYKHVYKFSKPGIENQVVLLDKKLNFILNDAKKNLAGDFGYAFKPRWDGNYVLNPLPQMAPESELMRDYADHIELRDCAFDPKSNRILVVNEKENAIWVYDGNDNFRKESVLTLALYLPLKSPEGITVDSDGDIFIADWGNHRIVRLNSEGRFINTIGVFGSNSELNIGAAVRLVLPTRVWAVPTKPRQVNLDSKKTYFSQDYLYIADFNGIHICKMDGTYLETLVKPADDLARGAFYGFAVAGPGEIPRLYLLKRSSKNPGAVLEYTSN